MWANVKSRADTKKLVKLKLGKKPPGPREAKMGLSQGQTGPTTKPKDRPQGLSHLPALGISFKGFSLSHFLKGTPSPPPGLQR